MSDTYVLRILILNFYERMRYMFKFLTFNVIAIKHFLYIRKVIFIKSIFTCLQYIVNITRCISFTLLTTGKIATYDYQYNQISSSNTLAAAFRTPLYLLFKFVSSFHLSNMNDFNMLYEFFNR